MRIGMVGLKGIPVSYGGVETHVLEVAPRLARRGHEVTVFSRSHCTPRIREHDGVRIVRLPAVRRKVLEMASHTVLSVIASWFEDFDILHFHSVEPSLFAPMAKWHTPVVSTSHGQAYRRDKWGAAAKWACHRAESVFMRVPDARIAVSRTLQRYYEARYHRPVAYVPNGVTIHTPVRGHDVLDRHGLVPGEYLLFAGRLDPTKCCHLAIDGYLRSGVEQKLAVIGGSTYTDEYVAKLNACRCDRIVFLGHQSGSDFWQLMQNCSAFVFPSEIEGMSIVLLEALGNSLPVIYSDIPENVEVAEGVGFGFRVGDAEDLATRMKYVAEHPAEACERAERGRETVRRRFDWDAVADRTEKEYRRVLAIGRRAGPTRAGAR